MQPNLPAPDSSSKTDELSSAECERVDKQFIQLGPLRTML